ncbi:glucose dehydrogenase [FAD, quinone] isoform X2 [Orussus abietinus]|nr:glucose dehydrogenase [FAD, quinone] isoform X2 [Orussus abietinus]
MGDSFMEPPTATSGSCVQCQFEDTTYFNAACGSLTSFMMLLQTLMMAKCDISDPCRRAGRNEIPREKRYDFIIVGAGVAGPVLARRLSDNPEWKVLLVEAGPEEPTMTSLPGLAFNAINSSLDWRFLTEPTKPHPTACLESGGVCAWPRGKMVSGTGGMYGMMYARGHPEIYNRWARMGNKGWSYGEIEHYFERAENPQDPRMVSNQLFSRLKTGGPMKINYFPHKPDFADYLVQAAKELGHRTMGLSGLNQTGFMIAPMLTDNGIRGTTSRNYLRPIARRRNLDVLTNAHVTRVVIDERTKRATGVEYVDFRGRRRGAVADKEVVLTAGAIGSPQILMTSGVGIGKDLEALGIPVVKDLPVGRNLHNHVSVPVKMSINDTHFETLTLTAVNEFVETRTGPISSTGLTQVTAFLESRYAVPGVPDLQVFFDGFSSTCPKTGHTIECPNGSLGTCPTRRDIVARPTVVIANTRGYMTLRSKNPLDPPLLYPNYFEDPQDVKVLIEGIRKVTELADTKAMKMWDLQLDSEKHPWCTGYHFGTDAYWECVIRARTGPENHQSGTCKMGPSWDPEAVTDPQLRVYGIDNVRVADASIFPIVPNANPVAAVIMVAEKAADLIRDTWSQTRENPPRFTRRRYF